MGCDLMPGPNVVLTFGGDSSKLENAFDRVGSGARDMGREVGAASDGFDKVGEAADTVDTRSMGFRDTLTGIQDGFAGIKKATSDGLGFESLLLIGTGVGDLASGFFNFLIPGMKSAVTWLKALDLATVRAAISQKAAAVGAKIWAAGQWLLNTALLANPIVLIVVAVIALIAIIVIIATKTTWFQDVWRAVWGKIGDPVKKAWDWVKHTSASALSWMVSIPGKLKTAFSKVAGFISAPYRFAFNLIARAWNNTIGRLSWTVPSWIPAIGGNTVSVPHLPTFHSGGTVPGPPGREIIARLQAGERIEPLRGGGSGGGPMVLQLGGDGTRLGDLLVEIMRIAIKSKGGNVQTVLGRAGTP